MTSIGIAAWFTIATTTTWFRVVNCDENNNEVEPRLESRVRIHTAPSRRVIITLTSFALVGTLAMLGFVAFNGSQTAPLINVNLQILGAPKYELQESSGTNFTKELTIQDVLNLASLMGSPRLPNSELKRLEESEEICSSTECLEAASSLMHSLNFSVDPCEDFYQFTCGQWIAENHIPESESRWNQFNILRDRVNAKTNEILTAPKDPADALPINQVKDFYKLCTDTVSLDQVGLQPLREILRGYGDWPLLLTSNNAKGEQQQWQASGFNWVQVIADTGRRFQILPLISINVDQDWKATDTNIVYVDQPSLVLPRTMLVDETHQYDEIKEGYVTYISEVATLLAKKTNDGATDPDPESLRSSAQAVVAFEEKLAKLTSKDEDRTNNDRMYNKRTLVTFQSETRVIGGEFEPLDWKQLLKSAFSSSGVTIGSAEPLIVPELEYFNGLTELLANAEKETVANYVLFRVADQLAGHTTQELRDIKFKFTQLLTGAKKPQSRAQVCADDANAALGMAIGVKYIAQEFDEAAKSSVNAMVDDLRFVFNDILQNLASGTDGWMDTETSQKAQEKLAAIKPFMAYPNWLQNRSKIEELYAGLSVDTEDHLTNVENILAWSTDDALRKLRKPVDRDFWLAYPGVVNAFYSPTHNSITFPAGILQAPFFKQGFPGFLNYGGIGSVIGHEMTHGFDNNGRQFDEQGNLHNWWSEETLTKFQDKTKCIVGQYGSYKPDAVDLHVNGELTQGENIADNGGIHEAFLAYQRHAAAGAGPDKRLPGLEQYSPEQLFFVGYARVWCENITPQALKNQILTNPHSPGQFRVKGPLTNSATFSDAWKCAQGTKMNSDPAARCVLW